MKQEIAIKIVLRTPRYPVILISSDRLYSGSNINELVYSLISSYPLDGEDDIKIIDCTGKEFYYLPDEGIVFPGFTFTQWTKRKIIDLYNESINSKETKISYSIKSLSSKKLSRIVKDICELIETHF
jgi:hypothetical protein